MKHYNCIVSQRLASESSPVACFVVAGEASRINNKDLCSTINKYTTETKLNDKNKLGRFLNNR